MISNEIQDTWVNRRGESHDRTSYIQIHNDMKTKITTGAWQVGSRIPSERKLAEDYGVSRMTLRQAVQNLIDDGLLRRAVGSGTYVTSQKN